MARKKLPNSVKTGLGLLIGVSVGIGIAIAGERLFGDPFPEASKSELKERFGLWLVPLAVILSLLAAIIAVAVHELGHLIGGLIARLRFHFYIVGPLRVERGDHDRIRVTLNRDAAFMGGAVAMLPEDTHDLKRRVFILVAGGPLASVLLAILAFMIPSPLVHVLGIMSGAIFLATIIPMQVGGLMTDGRRMLRLAGTGPAAEREAAMLPLLGAWSSGTPPREWPRDLLDAVLVQPDGGIDEYNARIFAYFHSLDAGDVDTAREHVRRALELVAELPAAFRPSMELEAAYFIARYDADVARARELFAKVPKRGLGITEYERARTEAAILMQEGNTEEARRIAQQALDATPARNAFARGRLQDLLLR